ncbi:MAG: YadA-like family protein [Gammaproteobacteria bacterium]|nr:YadA-like family protein [Gammaproteobacteria bacterium]
MSNTNSVVSSVSGGLSILTNTVMDIQNNGLIAVRINNPNLTDSKALGTNSLAFGPGALASGTSSIAIGLNASAGSTDAIAIGTGANASFAGSIAIGAGAIASADPTVAIGNNAVASGNNSTALGANSSATGSNSVALGQGSTATRDNTVSVGSSSQTRQITNVAAGTAATDAVNVSQLQSATASINNDMNTLSYRITDVKNQANAGIAAAMSMGNSPFVAGAITYYIGGATYGGQSAFGVTVRRTSDNGVWSIEGGLAGDQYGVGGRIGVSGVLK